MTEPTLFLDRRLAVDFARPRAETEDDLEVFRMMVSMSGDEALGDVGDGVFVAVDGGRLVRGPDREAEAG